MIDETPIVPVKGMKLRRTDRPIPVFSPEMKCYYLLVGKTFVVVNVDGEVVYLSHGAEGQIYIIEVPVRLITREYFEVIR